jgi:hypothetical protein
MSSERPEVGQRVWVLSQTMWPEAVLVVVTGRTPEGWCYIQPVENWDTYTLGPEQDWWPETQEYGARVAEHLWRQMKLADAQRALEVSASRMESLERVMPAADLYAWVNRASLEHLGFVVTKQTRFFTDDWKLHARERIAHMRREEQGG